MGRSGPHSGTLGRLPAEAAQPRSPSSHPLESLPLSANLACGAHESCAERLNTKWIPGSSLPNIRACARATCAWSARSELASKLARGRRYRLWANRRSLPLAEPIDATLSPGLRVARSERGDHGRKRGGAGPPSKNLTAPALAAQSSAKARPLTPSRSVLNRGRIPRHAQQPPRFIARIAVPALG